MQRVNEKINQLLEQNQTKLALPCIKSNAYLVIATKDDDGGALSVLKNLEYLQKN